MSSNSLSVVLPAVVGRKRKARRPALVEDVPVVTLPSPSYDYMSSSEEEKEEEEDVKPVVVPRPAPSATKCQLKADFDRPIPSFKPLPKKPCAEPGPWVHPIALKLDTKGFMSKLSLLEAIPLCRIKKLETSGFILRTLPELEPGSVDPKGYREQAYANELAQIKAYCALHSEVLGGMVVTYQRPKHGWGRCFPVGALGLSSFRRVLRNTLIHGLYSDFDIVNCHVMILCIVMESNGHKCPLLRDLCDHRDRWFELVCDAFDGMEVEGKRVSIGRSEAKKLFLVLVFGGSFDTWAKEYHFNPLLCPTEVSALANELTAMADIILRANNGLRRESEKLCPDNVRGSVLALFLQEQETRIVGAVLQRIKRDGQLMHRPGCQLLVGTYEYDGIKLLNENVVAFGGKDLVVEYLNRITEEVTHFPLQWIEKPLDGVDTHIEWDEEDKRLDEPLETVNDPYEGALAVLRQFPHWKVCAEKLWVFDAKSGLWSDRRDTHGRVLLDHKDCLHVSTRPVGRPSSSGAARVPETRCNLATDPTHCVKVLTMIRSVPDEELDNLPRKEGSPPIRIQDPDWLLRSSTSSVGKLLFTNGVYHSNLTRADGTKGVFVPITEAPFDPDTVFYAGLGRSYVPPDAEMEKRIEEVRRKLFTDQYEDQADCLLQMLGLALFGIPLKRFVIVVGRTNSGKSILTKALQYALGPTMAGTFTGESLVRRKGSTADPAADNRWALYLQHKRFVFSNEMTRSAAIDGNKLKCVTGGDTVQGRLHFEGETNFIFRALPILFCNDIPCLTELEDAVSGRLWTFNIERRYSDNPIDCLGELRRDPDIESWILQEATQNALIHLLIRSAQQCNFTATNEFPECILKNRNEWLPEGKEGSVSLLLAHYDLTGNEDDFVPQSEILKFFKDQNATMSVAKIVRDLDHEVKKRKHVQKINEQTDSLANYGYGNYNRLGKKLRGFKGLRARADPDEVQEEETTRPAV